MEIVSVWGKIREMKGSNLKSIKEGTNITVVDVTEKQILVKGKSGRAKSWPYHKIQRIVEAMSTGRPIHVDTVLGGSGSSRNQPETILANLPNVEWLKYNGKKHIVWVKEETHRLGTTKEMDADRIEYLNRKLSKEGSHKNGYIVVFCKEMSTATTFYQNLLNVSPEQQSVTHAVFKKDGALVVLREAFEEVSDGKAFPMMIVENVTEYVEHIKNASNGLQFTELRGNLSMPTQIIIKDKSGYSLIVSEYFE